MVPKWAAISVLPASTTPPALEDYIQKGGVFLELVDSTANEGADYGFVVFSAENRSWWTSSMQAWPTSKPAASITLSWQNIWESNALL